MGISTSLPIPTNPPVLPGTAVKQSVYTNAGFTAGDYVYRYNGNSVGALPYFTGSASLPGVTNSIVVAGTKYTTYFGTSPTLTRASITTPTTLPSSYNVTLPSTSSIGSNYLAQQAITATAGSNYTPQSAVLKNGNIVVVWDDSTTGSTLYYKIYNNVGTAVYSGTISSNATFTSGGGYVADPNFAVCALNSGGFALTYREASDTYARITTYDSTGTLVATTGSNGNLLSYTFSICADSNDNIYVIRASSTSAAAFSLVKFTSSLTFSTNSSNVGTFYYVAPKITFTLSGHLAYGYNNGSNQIANGLYNSTLTSTISGATLTIPCGSQGNFGICPSLDSSGGAFLATLQGGQMTILYLYFVSGSSGSYANTNAGPAGGTTAAYQGIGIFPIYATTAGVNDGSSNSIVVYYSSATAGQYRTAIVNLSSNKTTFSNSASTPVIAFTGSSSSYYYGSINVSGNGGQAGFFFNFNASSYASFMLSGTYVYASTSATASTQASLQPTPSNGYSLIGVATTTAAAGSYGSVVINGTVSLASTYATSSTAYGFNFNATNGYGFLGNKGYVVNRVVTLQGLE